MVEKENRVYGYRLRMNSEENDMLNRLSNHLNIKKSKLLRRLINDEYQNCFKDTDVFDEEIGYPYYDFEEFYEEYDEDYDE